MRKTLIITDLTRMYGQRVCIAGLDSGFSCIRPVLPSGVYQSHLYVGDKLVVRPMAKVSFDFYHVPLDPPHTEDLGFRPDSVASRGLCAADEWENVLQKTSFDSVEEAFAGWLQNARWVCPGTGIRSLGTVTQVEVQSVSPDCRLSFADRVGLVYANIPIQDLAFRAFTTAMTNRLGSPDAAFQRVRDLLKRASRLYLRLGLARPWQPDSHTGLRCYLQVTGVHTFPDYLEGKTFADF